IPLILIVAGLRWLELRIQRPAAPRSGPELSPSFRRLRLLHLRRNEAPMNVRLPVHIDKPAFLAWVQGREERYELASRRVVMMPVASRAHGLIVGNLFALLRGKLDPKQWAVIVEFGLDAGPETLRFPDLVVDRAGGGANDHVATAPVLLAEVLSPSTAEIDLG